MKLAHIALSVEDLERSAGFYRRHFGLRLLKKYRFKEQGLTIALLKRDALALELFEFKEHRPLPRYRRSLEKDLRTLGVKHFAVEVRDFLGTFKKLKEARVEFASELNTFVNKKRYFFIKDPDGILVEIMEGL